jgi:hypothetical protein
VLAVEMGERPTTGYGFDTKTVTAYRAGDTAVIKLAYHQPEPGAVTAQMMTSPCILLRLPLESFCLVQVLDRNGRMLTQIAPP